METAEALIEAPEHGDTLARSFDRSHAIIVGVDAYDLARGISPLRSAVNDAEALRRALARHQGFDAQALMNPTTEELRALLGQLPNRVAKGDRVLFYFAGHGLWQEDDGGPGGYLLLRDARSREVTTFLPMRELNEALSALPCRHLLVVLDCCFAGAFRWTSTRDVQTPRPVSRQRFERYVEAAAWQAITSAAPDQQAFDGLGERDGGADGHSPFAAALLEGLAGAADVNGDGLITATELYLYTRDRVEDATETCFKLQSPGLFPLRKHDRGEFVFRTPGRALRLPPAEALTLDRNPYRGLSSFDEAHRELYFGRSRAVLGLAKAVLRHSLTVVLGASGTGKSSLVKAGLLPLIRRRAQTPRPGKVPWHVLGPYRPREAIDSGLLTAERPDGMTVVVIDQLEEVLTQRAGRESAPHGLLELLARWIAEAPDRVRVIVTLRSDFEPLIEDGPLAAWWQDARYVVPPMTLDELRAAIERPAEVRDLHFEPTHLVDQIANEVVQMPGALPLLSFTLSELYCVYCQRGDNDRALRAKDYRTLGGVARAVTLRAEEELEKLVEQDPRYLHTVRNVMLRSTDEVGGELARRRVSMSELVYEDAAEHARVQDVLHRYVEARLFVDGAVAGEVPAAERAYVEPAHDVLIRGWPRMLRWLDEIAPQRPLGRAVASAARVWSERGDPRYLWHADPRLAQLALLVRDPGHPLNAVELRFARQSLRRRRNRRVRLGAIVTSVMIVLAATAAIALFQRDRAIEARDAEVRSRDRAEELVDHMAYDLPGLLQAVGQPGALQSTADRIGEYYRSLQHDEPSLGRDERRRLLAGRNALANVRLEQDHLDQASEGFGEALQHGEALARRFPRDAGVQRDLYVARMGLSAVAARREDWARAVEEARFARAIIEALLSRRPGEPRWSLDRAQVLLRQGQLAARSDAAAARATIEQAVASFEPLVKAEPKDQEAVLGLEQALRVLVSLMDPSTEGMPRARHVVRTSELLRTLPTGGLDARLLDARSRAAMAGPELLGLAQMRQVLDQPDSAPRRAILPQIVKLHAASVRDVRGACLDRHVLARLAPRNLAWRRMGVECRRLSAQLHLAAGDGRRTDEALDEAWQAQLELEQAFPGNPEVDRDGALVLDAGGILARQRGDLAGARQIFARSLERARKHAKHAPADARHRASLAVALINLADVEADRGSFDEVRAHVEEALGLCAASADAQCAQVRAHAGEVPRRAEGVPLALRFQVRRTTGLDGRVAAGASCAAYLRPPPARADDGCHRATISCDGWRVLGADLAMGQISVVGAGAPSRAPCGTPSRLDLATGTLHLEESSLLGTYALDAAVVAR